MRALVEQYDVGGGTERAVNNLVCGRCSACDKESAVRAEAFGKLGLRVLQTASGREQGVERIVGGRALGLKALLAVKFDELVEGRRTGAACEIYAAGGV